MRGGRGSHTSPNNASSSSLSPDPRLVPQPQPLQQQQQVVQQQLQPQQPQQQQQQQPDDVVSIDQQRAGRDLARQLHQIAGGMTAHDQAGQAVQRSITEGDLEFLKFLSYDDLTSR